MKYKYFDDNNDDDIDDDKPFPDDVSIKQESDTEFDDAETIWHASPQRESDNKINKKEYKEPQLETADKIQKQVTIEKDSFMKTESEINKVYLEAFKEAELKRIQGVFEEVKEEKDIKDFFIYNNNIFDSDEISENDRKFIMDLIDRTSFMADTQRFVEDTKAKMEIVELAVKQEIEKKSRNQLMWTKKWRFKKWEKLNKKSENKEQVFRVTWKT